MLGGDRKQYTFEDVRTLDRAALIELGRAIRKEVPRSAHASFASTVTRDPVQMLEESNQSRVEDLVPIRYGRMLVSPFTYLRGSPGVMAADLSGTPRSGIIVQACGDAHLLNFGLYGSPERQLVFDLNDFDETLPAPWEWDVKRLAASVVVAAHDSGFSEADAVSATTATVAQYRETIAESSTMTPLDVWYSHIDSDVILAASSTGGDRRYVEERFRKARSRDNMQALAKLATIVDGDYRIIEDPPLVERDPRGPKALANLEHVFEVYRDTLPSDRRHLLEQYRFVDIARKVVGVGSVGTRCWIMLGASIVDNSPLWLQIKEAQPSALAPYAGASVFENQGERVIDGLQLMQSVNDIFLGWLHSGPFDFYARQLRDMKGGVDLATISAKRLVGYGRLCGNALARSHARSTPAALISGYLGSNDTFDRAVTDFALTYAKQNERDYEALQEAERSGRITALHDH